MNLKLLPSVFLLAGCLAGSACRSRAADTAAAGVRTDSGSWTVTPEAVGPIRFGMTAREASAAAGGAAGQGASADSGCGYWLPTGAPAGLRVMMQDGVAVRADADSAGITTVDGLAVGSPVESVVAVLGPSLQITPHKYQWELGWRYFTFGGDSTHRLVFEVDSHVVRKFRAGLLPAVEYVEGCS